MSVENPENGEHAEVLDEEGEVDTKVKNRIIKARERVDETEQQLYVGSLVKESVSIPDANRLQGYGLMVRQYIRTVKPLLASAGIEKSEYYWKHATIFSQEVQPPAGKYNWPLFCDPEIDNTKLKREFGLPSGFEPPEAKVFEISGLRDVLDKHQMSLSWRFDLAAGTGDTRTDIEELQVGPRPLPKSVYEQAVELTDEFLQLAGVGLEIGSGGLTEDQLAPDY